jgi:hypothetical protein
VAGCLLWLLFRDGNLIGSRTKNTGLEYIRTRGVRDQGTKTYNVVPHNVVIAFLREELDREASHVPNRVCAALFSASSAETKKDGSFLAHAIEELGRRERRYIIGDLELAPSTCSFGMNNSTRC